ncbi:MAG: tRNA (adenosine(37)-N6)-threonylcarbamoyltransferase complex ATPase subunit type 1 TsaE [Actinobacteria bacterium]|nr:tRNA (adenosine(37)-N6)-threonylcarbamoyltransferase complex ATPase subunit type 1 TsaE [Actinomycetota bacterium]
MELISDSIDKTISLGMILGRSLAPGDVVCLEGELGTGKTVMVHGIARGRGHTGTVPSPTFTIIHTYPGVRLCHADAFRLSGADELLDAGIEEYLGGDWVLAVEWADRVRDALPGDALTVHLAFGNDDNERLLTIEATGERGLRLADLMEGVG